MTKIELAATSHAAGYAGLRPGFGLREVLRRFRWNSQNAVEWLVLSLDGQARGWVNLGWRGMKHGAACPDIFDLYVAEAFRSRGFGGQLIAACRKS
jgi:GNAT superfamily N-acetyltransferase